MKAVKIDMLSRFKLEKCLLKRRKRNKNEVDSNRMADRDEVEVRGKISRRRTKMVMNKIKIKKQREKNNKRREKFKKSNKAKMKE